MFKDGLKDGKGKWRKIVNSTQQDYEIYYEGDYGDDKKNGYGEFQWSSGNKYKGYYIDDVRQGFGEMSWIDGSIYRGYWNKGI